MFSILFLTVIATSDCKVNRLTLR